MMKRFHMLNTVAALCCLAFILSAAGPASAKAPKLSKDDQKKYDLAFDQVSVHFEKFKTFLEDDKTKDAIKELETITAVKFPAAAKGSDGVMLQVEAHVYLGEMLTEQGDFQGAVDTLLDGIDKAPDVDQATYDLYMALGHAYKKMKKNDEALTAFDKADDINKALQDKEDKGKK